MQVPRLSDGTVTLRAHTDHDVDRIVEQCVDPLSIEWTIVPEDYTRDDAKRFVRHAMPGGWESDQEWGFAVEHAGRFAGTVSLRGRGGGRAEIAYGAHPDVRGQGVMSRALRLLLGWGFSPVADGGRDLETVVWMANRGNWASRRLAWSVGFSFDATMRGWLPHRGRLVDAWVGTLRRGEPLTPAVPWLETPTIHGDQVVLRALADTDLPRVVETLNDDLTQFWLYRPRVQAPHTLDSQADFVLVRHEQAAAGRALHWAVVDPRSDEYLGQVSLFDLEPDAAEVGYWSHPSARGRGVMTEAARLVARHAVVPRDDGGLGLRRLWADAAVTNAASHHVLEAAGFARVGVQRERMLLGDGTWSDAVCYDLVATDVTAD